MNECKRKMWAQISYKYIQNTTYTHIQTHTHPCWLKPVLFRVILWLVGWRACRFGQRGRATFWYGLLMNAAPHRERIQALAHPTPPFQESQHNLWNPRTSFPWLTRVSCKREKNGRLSVTLMESREATWLWGAWRCLGLVLLEDSD